MDGPSTDNLTAINATVTGTTVQALTLAPADLLLDEPGEVAVNTAIGWSKSTLTNSTIFTLNTPNAANMIVDPSGTPTQLNPHTKIRATRYFTQPGNIEHFYIQIEGTFAITTFNGSILQ